MIAQTFALPHPQMVRSLCLLGTVAKFSEGARTALRERARLVREEGMAAVAPLSIARWFTRKFTRKCGK